MRFLVGVLALAVLGVLVGAPAAFMLGWSPLSATNRQSAGSPANSAAPASKSSGESAVTVRPKGSFS
jgi:hypothetical protein